MYYFYCSVAAFALFTSMGASAQDCAVRRNATPQDISRGEGVVLLRNMIAACKAQSTDSFFRLITTGTQRLVAGVSYKKGLLANYCEFTNGAVKSLAGNVESGNHSIGPHKGKSACGAPASYWFVHTKDGALALRLAVAVEAGQLKIADH